MIARIKGAEVVGIISDRGKCPSCHKVLIVRDEKYVFIKNRGAVEFNDGTRYIKCICGKFVMLKGMFN